MNIPNKKIRNLFLKPLRGQTMFNLKIGLPLLAGLLAISSPAHSVEKTKYGVSVTYCGSDYDQIDFCDDKLMKSYAKVMNSRSPNFDRDKIIYIFERNKDLMDIPNPKISKYYRLVVIDPKNKMVNPATFGIADAIDADDNLVKVNNNGDHIEFDFNAHSNLFCFKGTFDQYRRGSHYQYKPYCFNYEMLDGDNYPSFFLNYELFNQD